MALGECCVKNTQPTLRHLRYSLFKERYLMACRVEARGYHTIFCPSSSRNGISTRQSSLIAFAPSEDWRWQGSNLQPPACKAGALPVELHPRTAWRKSEAQNPKFQTNSKSQFSNAQNVLNIRVSVIWYCFGFRYSNFEFSKPVGPGRVELPTLRLSGARSNQLSYEPKTQQKSRVL